MAETSPDSPKQVRPFFSPLRAGLRRLVFFGSVAVVNVAATYWLYDIFERMGVHRAHGLLLIVFNH